MCDALYNRHFVGSTAHDCDTWYQSKWVAQASERTTVWVTNMSGESPAMETGEITEGLEWGSFEVNEQAAAQGANTGPSTVETELVGEPPELSLAGESVGPTHRSPSTGPVEEPSTPLGPWTHGDNRCEQELRQREIERLVVENARMRNAHMSDQEELRDARTRLEMQERERNVLESLARSSISGAGAGPTVVIEVRAPSGGKIAQPRESSQGRCRSSQVAVSHGPILQVCTCA